MSIAIVDEGLQQVPDESGEMFDAYVTCFETRCKFCEKRMTGRNAVDVRLAELGGPNARGVETAAFDRMFRETVMRHERGHWLIRALCWLARWWAR